MKLCGILLLMIMLAPFAAQAQETNMQVEVYLKDRDMVRGTIIEEIPHVSLTLQTDDGNIIVYKMEEIEKYRQDYFYGGNEFTGKEKTSGYRGFVELGGSVGDESANRVEILTSHGFQILPYLFTGIGTGLQCYFSRTKKWDLPFFADIQWEPLKMPITPFSKFKSYLAPFIDLKIGCTAIEPNFYMYASIGCRFPLDDSIMGLNIRLGYSMWKNCQAFTATIGVDF